MTQPTNQPILRAEALTRRYGGHLALDSLWLEVSPGEVFGYIGPNGAGKTTTFRILSGLLAPSSGRALIDGEDVTGDRDRIKQLVGYLPDNFGVYPSLRVWEYLDFFAAAYRLPARARGGRIDECLRIAGATEFRDKLMGSLSRGMKQRVGIAKTLIHDPRVIILDEPAATIDPRARIQMRGLFRDLAKIGKAVLISSHILPELADMCDRIGILKQGRLVACGSVEQVLRELRKCRVIEVRVLGESSQATTVLERLGFRQVQSPEPDGLLRFETDATDEQLAAAPGALVGAGVRFTEFREQAANLEDAFMSLT